MKTLGTTLFETTVAPEQIDHLGHLNVRYYGEFARRGEEQLLLDAGVDPVAVAPTDTYTRHRNEQFAGAPLAVRGGWLETGTTTARSYTELVNTDTGAIAAAYIRELTGPEGVWAGADAPSVTVPEHGRPRSIDLAVPLFDRAPSVATLLEDDDLAMRQPRKIDELECGDDGAVPGESMQFLIWGGTPIERPGRTHFHHDTEARIAFAVAESRAAVRRRPTAGTRIQSFGADVGIGSRTIDRRNWVVDLDTDELIACFSSVTLCLDLEARRSVEIPEQMREETLQWLRPDLGSDSALGSA